MFALAVLKIKVILPIWSEVEKIFVTQTFCNIKKVNLKKKSK